MVPDVQVQGTLAEQALQDTFSPRLTFRLDPTQLQLEPTGVGLPDGPPDQLQPAAIGKVMVSRTEPTELSGFGLLVSTATARRTSEIGGLGFVGRHAHLRSVDAPRAPRAPRAPQ